MFSHEALTHEKLLSHIRTIYEGNYGSRDIELVEHVFDDVVNLFNGQRPGYQACDAQYHNLYHTFQTIPPFVEIIDGWNKSGVSPRISKGSFRFGVIGVLLHDTGYIKAEGDTGGTGAKYTFTHLQRSIDFAAPYLNNLGLEDQEVSSILNIIRCTGVTLDINIDFHDDEERIIGYALGTADLLGQMSAEDYIEKLPILYNEFAEAYRYEGLDRDPARKATLAGSANDLIRSTPGFYQNIALARFKLMGCVHDYIRYHFNTPDNPYIVAIEKNIDTIRSRW